MQYCLLITHIKWVFWESEIVLLSSAMRSLQTTLDNFAAYFTKPVNQSTFLCTV